MKFLLNLDLSGIKSVLQHYKKKKKIAKHRANPTPPNIPQAQFVQFRQSQTTITRPNRISQPSMEFRSWPRRDLVQDSVKDIEGTPNSREFDAEYVVGLRRREALGQAKENAFKAVATPFFRIYQVFENHEHKVYLHTLI